MPRLDDPLTGTEHELKRLRAVEMLDGGLFTFRDGKDERTRGAQHIPMLFPAERIDVQPGQSVRANITMNETTTMLNMACRSPYANALSISTSARETLGLDDTRLEHLGVTVDKALLTVTGRVLGVPLISYAASGCADALRRPHEQSRRASS
ncbi:hypothetical protein Purlil1_14162 [Purpureocillium lilacinum]|uniref:Uncharacterized protein n=1 Tax=Purpureocillium lilacinum TaxID=33203 RepID=A0ABR0BC19_PURLI|nr:hypothetical protein Purlil1_14162 [Purpureocillium lilacinum]